MPGMIVSEVPKIDTRQGLLFTLSDCVNLEIIYSRQRF
jgi:hypothetical protein